MAQIFLHLECGFTLKRVREMTRTYSQMHLLLVFKNFDLNLIDSESVKGA